MEGVRRLGGGAEGVWACGEEADCRLEQGYGGCGCGAVKSSMGGGARLTAGLSLFHVFPFCCLSCKTCSNVEKDRAAKKGGQPELFIFFSGSSRKRMFSCIFSGIKQGSFW